MAKVTSLNLRGYKGQNTVEHLTGLDMFVGPNGSGKSSRPEGLSLAMLGYIPGRQKRAEEIMKVSAGDKMSVGLTLDTGFSFLRTFTRNTSVSRKTGEEKISIKESLSVTPSKGESTETERKARIAEELGDFSIHLDFAEFEAMSPAKKREYLYGFVSGTDGWTKEKVAQHLREYVATEEMRQNNPEAHAIALRMVDEALAVWIDGLSVDDGVLAMLEWAKEQQTIWNAKRKDAAGAVRQLADLKNQMEITDRDISLNKEALSKLRRELVDVEKELSRGQEIKKQFEARKSRIGELETKLAKLQKELGPADTTNLDKQIEELKKQIVDESFDTSELDQKIKEATARLEDAENTLNRIKADKTTLTSELNTLVRAAEVAGKSGGLCVISRLIACPKNFTPFIDYVKAEEERVRALVQGKNREEAQQAQVVAAIRSEISELNAGRKQHFDKVRKAQANNDRLKATITGLERQKLDLENAATLQGNRFDMWQAELDRLQQEPVDPVPDMDVLALQSKGLRKSIEDLEAKIAEQDQSRATLLSMQSSMLDNKDAEYRWNAAVSIVEMLGPKGIQGELLKGGLEPLRESIQENFDILGIPFKFAFRTESDRGQEIFEFGWIKDGSFISFDSLSTGERLVVLLAVLTSLLQQGDAEVRILAIDEFQSLDADNFELTLGGLKVLHDAGQLDNVLVAGVMPITKLDGWNVRVLGTEVKQEQVS